MAEKKEKVTVAKKVGAGKQAVATVKSKVAAVVPAAKKVAAAAVKKVTTPAAEKKAAVRKPASSKAKSSAGGRSMAKPSPEERYRMVQTAAYFIAERHGFQGSSTEHWAAAEYEISVMLGE